MSREIKTIAHLSDIHIRKLHRLKEYREVFDRLYVKLKEIKPDLIYLGGDIVHGKLDTSPEETRLVSDFLLNLCSITDTILITGNHDMNIQNKGREDALSPIVDLVRQINPKLHYWKASGKYSIGNVDFSLLSVYDIDKDGNQSLDNFVPASAINNKHKIALHHGPVDSFEVDNGFTMKNDRVRVGLFDGFDITMLGDIHKRQFLNEEETIAYCGSLIQQGFAEEPSKGFLLWNVEDKTSKFIQVENDYGYKTIIVKDGVIENKMRFVPPKGNIRIKYWNTTYKQLQSIQIKLRKKYRSVKEIKAEKQDVLSKTGQSVNRIDIGDVRDMKFQNTLLREYLQNTVENMDPSTLERIININEQHNNVPEIQNDGMARHVNWKLKEFYFDNMFSYAKDNHVRFDKLKGIVGLVAPNHSGKSSLLDAVSYTIFDLCSRTTRAIDVLNKKKSSFLSKLNIEVNGNDYWIERIGTKRTRRHKNNETTTTCPVKVDFYMYDDANEKVDLTGAARRNSQYGGGTNEEIQSVIGNFDDFILTSLSLQQNGTNFLEKKQSERKQILSKFMDVGIFDKLYDLARESSNEDRALLRSLTKRDSYTELATVDERVSKLMSEEQIVKDTLDKLIKEETNLSEEKMTLVKKKWNIQNGDLDIENLQSNFKKVESTLQDTINTLNDDTSYKEKLRPLYLQYHSKLNVLDEDDIRSRYTKFTKNKHTIQSLQNELQSLTRERKSISHSMRELNKYKYDKECPLCLGNADEHIKHQTEYNKKHKELTNKIDSSTDAIEVLEESLIQLASAEEQDKLYHGLIDELNRISQDAIKVGGKITTATEKVKLHKEELKRLQNQIDQYYDNEAKINTNKDIDSQILIVEQGINQVDKDKNIQQDLHRSVLNKLAVAKTNKEQLEETIKQISSLEQRILDYDIYMSAMSRDGISYDLIGKTVESIEAEINEVLNNMMVGFTIKLLMDGKNIDTFICYGDDMWSLDLASGMEKFVSNLAIRVGLINVSTLPRPNFLCIDEGFGTLDGESIVNMEGAFNYLKTQFDFVLIITHLDSIKDYVDHLIPIDVIDGYSNIKFS